MSCHTTLPTQNVESSERKVHIVACSAVKASVHVLRENNSAQLPFDLKVESVWKFFVL